MARAYRGQASPRGRRPAARAEALVPCVLPLLVLDECGPRVSELESSVVGDLDEERRAIRVRPDAEKNERYRYLQLPDGPLRCAPGDAATTRKPRPRCAALPRRDRRESAHGDRPRLSGEWHTAFQSALAPSQARFAPLQAHELTRRGCRTPGRLEARRLRPLRLRARRSSRGRAAGGPRARLVRCAAACVHRCVHGGERTPHCRDVLYQLRPSKPHT